MKRNIWPTELYIIRRLFFKQSLISGIGPLPSRNDRLVNNSILQTFSTNIPVLYLENSQIIQIYQRMKRKNFPFLQSLRSILNSTTKVQIVLNNQNWVMYIQNFKKWLWSFLDLVMLIFSKSRESQRTGKKLMVCPYFKRSRWMTQIIISMSA